VLFLSQNFIHIWKITFRFVTFQMAKILELKKKKEEENERQKGRKKLYLIIII